jgi:hypothetical protein
MSEEQKVDEVNSNPQENEEQVVDETVTPEETPVEPEVKTEEPDIDYKTKFSESSNEANRLYDRNKELRAQLEAKEETSKSDNYEDNPEEPLYPGFEGLGEDEQKNLVEYTNNIRKRAVEDMYKDPAIAFAKNTYNEQKFDSAFDKASELQPDLRDNRREFKEKYYNPSNVPENIDEIMVDLSKVYLFDKAKEIGRNEFKAQEKRIDTERADGGDKTPQASRSLEDWSAMARSNPAKFAQQAKQYNEDLASGKLE